MLIVLLAAWMSGCSSEGAKPPEDAADAAQNADQDAADAARTVHHPADAGDDDARVPSSPLDPKACDTRPEVQALQMVPEFPAVFYVADTACDKPVSSVFLVNTSDRTVRVEGLGVTEAELDSDSPSTGTAAFFASADSLPRDLEPNESLPIRIGFEADTPLLTATGRVVVATSDGCQELALQGVSVEENKGVTFGPGAVDFGVLRPNEVSTAMDIDFTFLLPAGAARVHFSAGGSSPEDVFETIRDVSDVVPDDCDLVSAAVRMVAPSTTGPVVGSFFFEFYTDTASAIGQVVLRGLVRE